MKMSKLSVFTICLGLCYLRSCIPSRISPNLCKMCDCKGHESITCSWTVLSMVPAKMFKRTGFREMYIHDVPVFFHDSDVTAAICSFLSSFPNITISRWVDCAYFRAAIRVHCAQVCMLKIIFFKMC